MSKAGYVDHHIGWGMHNGSLDNHHHAMNSHLNHSDSEPEPGRHSCPRCGRTYKWKQTLLRHMKYECGVEPQFVCPVCRAPFHHRNVLQRHMNLHSRPKWRWSGAICINVTPKVRTFVLFYSIKESQKFSGYRHPLTIACLLHE